MIRPFLTAAALFLPLTAMSCPGQVDWTDPAGRHISSTGGSIEFDVIDHATGCHDWHGQGSATGSDIDIECTYTPATGQFSKTVKIKSLDTIQQLIEADKNQQAITAQALAALVQALGALAPKPVP